MKINIINVNFQTKKGKEKEILGNKKKRLREKPFFVALQGIEPWF